MYILCLALWGIILIRSSVVCEDGGWNTNYLSFETMCAEKGVAAMLIILHHLSQMVDLLDPLKIMGYVGFITVAFFYFCSGYGLIYNFRNNIRYLETFWKRRVQAVMVPYWILYIGILIWEKCNGTQVGWRDIIWMIIGGRSWFVLSIMFFYLAFYIAFKTTRCMGGKMEFGLCFLMLMVSGYCFTCVLLGLGSWWTASASGFGVGVFWHKIEKFFIPWIRKHYLLKGKCLFLLFCFLFLGRLLLTYSGINNVLLHFVIRNIVGAVFVVLVLFMTQKIQIGGVVLQRVGEISYEIFLVHMAVMWQIRKAIKSDTYFILMLVLVTIIISILIFVLSKFLKKII